MHVTTKTIYKYPIEITDEQEILAPTGWQPLSVQIQYGQPCIWALVDPEAKPVLQTVHVHGTGHPVRHNGKFLGTIQVGGGTLIFHVFTHSI